MDVEEYFRLCQGDVKKIRTRIHLQIKFTTGRKYIL